MGNVSEIVFRNYLSPVCTVLSSIWRSVSGESPNCALHFLSDSRLGLSARRTVALARWVTTETAGYDEMRESSHRLVAYSTEQEKSISAAQPMFARGT